MPATDTFNAFDAVGIKANSLANLEERSDTYLALTDMIGAKLRGGAGNERLEVKVLQEMNAHNLERYKKYRVSDRYDFALRHLERNTTHASLRALVMAVAVLDLLQTLNENNTTFRSFWTILRFTCMQR